MSRSTYERRVRLASEAATWGVGAILLGTAALPTTDSASRVGLLVSSLLLFLFAAVWFHLIPEPWLGRLRFATGTAITQIIAAILLVLTGGGDSRYFSYYLLPTLATAFGMRLSGTIVTGIVAVVGYVTILVTDTVLRADATALDIGIVRTLALVASIAMVGLISRTMQDARIAIQTQREELSARNRELEVARNTTLALARVRELHDLVRVIYSAASGAIGTDRLFLFASPPNFDAGYTIGPSGTMEEFHADPSMPEASPRRRAIRERRTVVIHDSEHDQLSQRVRERYGFGAGLFMPLMHRSEVVGVMAMSSPVIRQWTPAEIRLAEVIAEASAAAVASSLAFDALRVETDKVASRMKLLEGMRGLEDALSLATDEPTIGLTAARSIAQSFHLSAATALFVDPSVAILEPIGSAGQATAHPVVNGPTSCPAIRGGRLFRVTSAEDPVVCPFMPYRSNYACIPLVAAGDSVGALFLEPDADSIVEETLVRAAADRVALTLATRRVVESAQRQATTDGLTGLHNRFYLEQQLRLLHSLATRHGQPYSVVALDVDGLKSLNDTFGHEMGDLALRAFANTVKKSVRASDVGVRTGGDEFLVLMPQTGLDEAKVVAERLRATVEAHGRAEPRSAITVSAGVATWRSGRSAEQVLQAADSMLYAAKRAGKDRVMVEAPAAA